ncbi:hypothetical protein V500_00235 [Pseudogymnoascus sp. VKM F-4518 (FW-2643)]|nr:hypothetical protein V500_00235 [Pseudogymnoascus sp. VKM F-4518 (FW-2643)]
MAPHQPLSEIPCVGTATTVRSRLTITTVSRRAWEYNPLEDGPTRNVDYLSHKWEEEDIWTSWRYVVAKNDYKDKIRLENASWRSWAKLNYRLLTVSPETIDWSKDSDVTWLHGPLQIRSKRPWSWASDSSPPCDLSRANFALDKKFILRRKSTSKAISQRSLLARTLLKNAAAIVQAQEDINTQSRTLERSISEPILPRTLLGKYVFSSSSLTPKNSPTGTPSSRPQSPQGRCRIHFNNEVQHCYEPKYSEDRRGDKHQLFDNGESSDDWFLMKMRKGDNSNLCTASDGLRRENKNITPLLTTLKYQGNTPEISEKGFLATYDYATDQTGTWIGILIWIVAGYCFLGWQCWRSEGR